MKRLTKITAIILTLVMCMSFAAPVFAADSDAYTITNPYADINWETVGTYKTALHTHTNASDGNDNLKASIQRHVEAGFDIVATTDHGTVNYDWGNENVNSLVYGVMSLFGRSEGELVYLGSEGTFDNGISYTYGKAENGDDYLSLSTGKTVLRVPYGNEQNALSANAHVNSWFADYTQNMLTTYVDAIKGVDKKGGVSVINHPGEYTKARYEIYASEAYNEDNATYNYYINKFASLLDKYDTCIGIDMNSKGDGRTRWDRILWDNLLTRFAANGENVYAIASSDAHNLNVIDSGYVLALLEAQTSEELKACLENGEFFAGSHCIGNPEELRAIAAALKELYGETELYNKVNTVVAEMDARVAAIENGELDADEDIGIEYDTRNENGYAVLTDPRITAIAVDDEENTITVTATDALIIRWISGGELIDTLKIDAGTATIDLDDYSAVLGDYVRAEVFGEGGIIYTQAFLLNAEAKAGTSKVVDDGFIDLGILDCLFAIFKNWADILGRMF